MQNSEYISQTYFCQTFKYEPIDKKNNNIFLWFMLKRILVEVSELVPTFSKEIKKCKVHQRNVRCYYEGFNRLLLKVFTASSNYTTIFLTNVKRCGTFFCISIMSLIPILLIMTLSPKHQAEGDASKKGLRKR